MVLQVLELVWNNVKSEAESLSRDKQQLDFNLCEVLLKHKSLSETLAYILSYKLASINISFHETYMLIEEFYNSDPDMLLYAANDIYAIFCRDPVVDKYYVPILFFKGFHALQAYRLSHWLWNKNRRLLALYFQSQISCVFNVDVHPAASIGSGVIFDHATGIVIGETAVVEDNVSILQFVTLGGRNNEIIGDRHPKIRSGVMIGAGAIVLGNIEVGYCSKIGAGSVVLHSVPEHVTVAGNPAKVIEKIIEKKS